MPDADSERRDGEAIEAKSSTVEGEMREMQPDRRLRRLLGNVHRHLGRSWQCDYFRASLKLRAEVRIQTDSRQSYSPEVPVPFKLD